MIGQMVGHYRVLARLGGGGMGVVYKAEDTKLNRTVALKFLPPEMTSDERARARFIHEARATAKLDHPNICTIHEVGETDDGQIWIAMACYDGETLREMINRRPISIAEAIRIARQLASGLDKAHAAGIVHRDIKPANIIVTSDGIVKILDFGLAKLVGGSEITGAGQAVGTASYMAPEQIRAQEIGPYTDIWGLGMVLFELVAGVRPFRGDYPDAALYSILHDDPEPLSSLRPDAPPGLEAVLNTMLQRDPRDRFQSAADVIAHLDALAGGSSETRTVLLPSASGSLGRLRRVRRLPHVATGVAAVSLLALVSTCFVTSLNRETPRPAETASAADNEVVATAPKVLPDKPVVAILPFADLSDAPLAPDLGNAFAQALVARLGGVPDLQVLTAADVEAARATDANLVLRGTLQRSGETLRATWTIADLEGTQFGGNVAEGPGTRLPALQDDLARQIVDVLPPGFSEDRYLQAIGYLARYDMEASVDGAIAILESMGDSPRVQVALARAYLHKYRHAGRDRVWTDRANELCDRAESRNPGDPELHLTRGLIHLSASNLDDAATEIDLALELRPNDPDTRLARADLLSRSGRKDEAEAEFRRAIAMRPDNWSGYNQLGAFYLQQGEKEKALEALATADRLTPDNTYVLSNMGIALHWLGRYEEALDAYQRSIAVRPTSSTYANRGVLLYFLGRYDEAADAYERATALTPSNYQIWAGLADSLRWSVKGKARANAAYRKAIELAEARLDVSPRDPATLATLATCHAKSGNFDRAAELARLAVETAPEHQSVNYQAGVAMEVSGRRDEAVKLIRHALELGYTTEELRRDPELKALVNETDVLSGK
jgi:serine/threonine protein kinase/tetratricopeptide (TPR) repeat protein